MDADEESLFRICVNRRVLRASPDSVAAGCAVRCGKMISRGLDGEKRGQTQIIVKNNECQEKMAQVTNITR
jgi:hypothetical protein